MILPKPKHNRAGYTLIEVLTAAVIIGVAVSASVSMSATMSLQEELSWRVSVAMNYQENASRLWQLGLTQTDINAVMPNTAGNPFLNEILDTTGVNTITGPTVDASGMGVMESAASAVQVANFNSGDAGSMTTFNLYRNVTRGTAYEP